MQPELTENCSYLKTSAFTSTDSVCTKYRAKPKNFIIHESEILSIKTKMPFLLWCFTLPQVTINTILRDLQKHLFSEPVCFSGQPSCRQRFTHIYQRLYSEVQRLSRREQIQLPQMYSKPCQTSKMRFFFLFLCENS